MLLAARGLVVADDEAGVEATLRAWLEDAQTAAAQGQRAREAILAGRGATARTLEVLEPLLGRLRDRQ